MSKTRHTEQLPKHRDNPLTADGDFIYNRKMQMAHDLYVHYGKTIDQIVQETGLVKETVWDRVYYRKHSSTKEHGPWLEQRKQVRAAVICESPEETKLELCNGYKHLALTLVRTLENINKKLDSELLSPKELQQLASTLVTGIDRLHSIFVPALKQPLVNINMGNKAMNKDEIEAQLEEWVPSDEVESE